MFWFFVSRLQHTQKCINAKMHISCQNKMQHQVSDTMHNHNLWHDFSQYKYSTNISSAIEQVHTNRIVMCMWNFGWHQQPHRYQRLHHPTPCLTPLNGIEIQATLSLCGFLPFQWSFPHPPKWYWIKPVRANKPDGYFPRAAIKISSAQFGGWGIRFGLF